MTITNSLLRSWRACPRQAQISYDFALEAEVSSPALRRGTAFHAELAGEEYEADPFLRAAVRRVVERFRALEPVTIEQREVPFIVDVEGWDEPLAGTIDAIGRTASGRLVIVERKTTTDAESLMRNLHLDTQVLTYWLGARAVGIPVEAVLYSVQPWPGQRPLKATPPEARKYTKAGALYANQRLVDETPEEFAARLEIPDPVFQEVAVLHDDIESHLEDLTEQVRARSHGHVYRNPQACENCAFTAICRLPLSLESPPPTGFRRHARAGSAAHQAGGST